MLCVLEGVCVLCVCVCVCVSDMCMVCGKQDWVQVHVFGLKHKISCTCTSEEEDRHTCFSSVNCSVALLHQEIHFGK